MRQSKTRGRGTDNKTVSKEFIQLNWSRWERTASCRMPVWEWQQSHLLWSTAGHCQGAFGKSPGKHKTSTLKGLSARDVTRSDLSLDHKSASQEGFGK